MEQESQQKKSLLIIKSHAQGLGPAEGFLKNRGWDVKATANLKEALIHLVQNQPQFVMISIDHPNRKVRNLPKVLAQAFPVCVIAFSETASAANIKILSESSAEYAIFPPITGPAIERTVNKYYKDLQAKGLSPNSKGSTWEKNPDGSQSSMIAIKGNGAATQESAQNFLAQFLAGDGGDAIATTGSISSSENIMATGNSSSLGNTTSTGLASGIHGSSSLGNSNSALKSNPGINGGNSSNPMGSSNGAIENKGYYTTPPANSEEPHSTGYTPRHAKKRGPGMGTNHS